MKTIINTLLLAGLMLIGQTAKAQNITFSYPDNLSGYSLGWIPGSAGTAYLAGGTLYNTSTNNNRVHLYNTSTGTTFTVGDINMDDRCVRVVPIDPNRCAIVSYSRDLAVTSPLGRVRVTIMDYNGTIFSQKLYVAPTSAIYSSLYPLDATYDPQFNQIAICGMAANGNGNNPTVSKQAFVMTVDAGSMNLNNFAFYGPAGPYTIASRIHTIQAGGMYYVTGSENVNKGAGIVMGVRNMLIDAVSLNTLMSRPLLVFSNTNMSESGVDMFEMPNEYCLLVNSQQNTTWGIVRVSKGNLAPSIGAYEMSPIQGKAYGFQPGMSPTDAVAFGIVMNGSGQAEPFNSFLNFNATPANVFQEVEYSTVIGNTGFWSMGNFYANINGYPLPSYLPAFTCRESNAMGAPMEVVAPITGVSGFLNAKYVSTDPMGLSQCPFTNSPGGLNFMYNVGSTSLINFTYPSVGINGSSATSTFYNYFNKDLCTSGYYKLGTVSSSTNDESSALAYPNPCSDALHLNLNSYGNTEVNVELLDITGKKIASVYQGTAKDKIDYQLPQGISKGLYLLSIQTNTGDRRIEKISIN